MVLSPVQILIVSSLCRCVMISKALFFAFLTHIFKITYFIMNYLNVPFMILLFFHLETLSLILL